MKRRILAYILAFVLLFSNAMFIPSTTATCATKKMRINVRKATLTKNETYTLRVYNTKKQQKVTFTSEDNDIVSVSQDKKQTKSATITAVSIGSTVIHANVYNRKGKRIRNFKTTIKVTPYAISIKFTQTKVNLKVSDTTKLSFIVKPNISLETPIFESSNKGIVSVNSKGIITAISPGEAYITATLLSCGQRARCRVIVEEKRNRK